VRRASKIGNEGIALTDHADFSNYKFIIGSLLSAKKEMEDDWEIEVLMGVEITHVPPRKIDKLVRMAKAEGAEIILVHGETIVEPVLKGTNRVSVMNEDVDILAHPGLIDAEEVWLARDNGVALEISSRRGHSLTNGHVASLAMKYGADLVIDTDTHSPEDLIDDEMARKVLLGCGLDIGEANDVLNYARKNFG
jgi:Histidinol phosphatase and related hydrolases of the PHP family